MENIPVFYPLILARSQLPDDDQRRAALLQGQGKDGKTSLAKAQNQVRQRQGKPTSKPRGVKRTFITEEGWRITVAHSRQGNYHEVKEALEEALSEVQIRIDNDVTLS